MKKLILILGLSLAGNVMAMEVKDLKPIESNFITPEMVVVEAVPWGDSTMNFLTLYFNFHVCADLQDGDVTVVRGENNHFHVSVPHNIRDYMICINEVYEPISIKLVGGLESGQTGTVTVNGKIFQY